MAKLGGTGSCVTCTSERGRLSASRSSRTTRGRSRPVGQSRLKLLGRDLAMLRLDHDGVSHREDVQIRLTGRGGSRLERVGGLLARGGAVVDGVGVALEDGRRVDGQRALFG